MKTIYFTDVKKYLGKCIKQCFFTLLSLLIVIGILLGVNIAYLIQINQFLISSGAF